MKQSTYYTIRPCKPGEDPLEQRDGHHYERNYVDEGEAHRKHRLLCETNHSCDFYLLRTTVEVINAKARP